MLTPMLQNLSGLPLHPREAEIRATEAMEAEINESGTGIPPLMMERTPENRQVLACIGKFLTEDIPPVLAMTDPSRYRMLCRLRMEIILRGYYDSFRKPGTA
jgi:hypothetical protein